MTQDRSCCPARVGDLRMFASWSSSFPSQDLPLAGFCKIFCRKWREFSAVVALTLGGSNASRFTRGTAWGPPSHAYLFLV